MSLEQAEVAQSERHDDVKKSALSKQIATNLLNSPPRGLSSGSSSSPSSTSSPPRSSAINSQVVFDLVMKKYAKQVPNGSADVSKLGEMLMQRLSKINEEPADPASPSSTQTTQSVQSKDNPEKITPPVSLPQKIDSSSEFPPLPSKTPTIPSQTSTLPSQTSTLPSQTPTLEMPTPIIATTTTPPKNRPTKQLSFAPEVEYAWSKPLIQTSPKVVKVNPSKNQPIPIPRSLSDEKSRNLVWLPKDRPKTIPKPIPPKQNQWSTASTPKQIPQKQNQWSTALNSRTSAQSSAPTLKTTPTKQNLNQGKGSPPRNSPPKNSPPKNSSLKNSPPTYQPSKQWKLVSKAPSKIKANNVGTSPPKAPISKQSILLSLSKSEIKLSLKPKSLIFSSDANLDDLKPASANTSPQRPKPVKVSTGRQIIRSKSDDVYLVGFRQALNQISRKEEIPHDHGKRSNATKNDIKIPKIMRSKSDSYLKSKTAPIEDMRPFANSTVAWAGKALKEKPIPKIQSLPFKTLLKPSYEYKRKLKENTSENF